MNDITTKHTITSMTQGEHTYSIENKTIVEMKYHAAQGEGDAHYVDVQCTNGVTHRVFRPDYITFDKENENES